MLIGLKLAPVHVDYATLERTWMAAGASELLDSLWSSDHMYPGDAPGPCMEGWTALAVMAHRSGTKWLGHLVLAAPYRNASLLAKMATVMDHATGGRFILGLGAGHLRQEAQDFGLPMLALPDRLALLEATLRSIRSLSDAPRFAADAPPVTAAIGLPFGAPTEALFEPPSLTPGGPPIWLGTAGERIGLRLVARYAEGWNHSRGDVDTFARRLDLLHSYCEAIGRDPGDITVSVQLKLGSDDDARRETTRAAVGFAAAGCQHLILSGETREGPDVVQVAEKVAARVRDAVS